MDLKEEEILGDQVNTHWYYRAKVAALLRDLNGATRVEVLDIGAGSGFFSRQLLDAGAARATCVDTGYAQDRDETWHGKPIAFRRAIAGEVPDHRGYRYLSTDLREVSQLLAACRRDADKLSLPRG